MVNARRTPSRTPTRFGVIALVGVAIVALLWLLQSGAGAAGERPAEVRPERLERRDLNPNAVPANSGAQPERALVAAVESSEATTSPAPGHIHVRGTVVVVDPRGEHHREEDGQLEFILWEGDIGTNATVTVQHGRFSVDVPADHELELSSAILGNRPAKPSAERLPVGERLELRVTWLAPTVLRVVDAETGHDLTEITAVAATNWITDDCAHPGTYAPDAVRVEHGRSPLTLMSDAEQAFGMRWEESLWLHSPGYAWGQLTLDYTNPTERRIELQRGGTLEVRIEGPLPAQPRLQRQRVTFGERDDQPWLRLRESTAAPDIEGQVQEALERLSQFSDAELGGRPRPTAAELRQFFERAATRAARGGMVLQAHAPLDKPVVLEGIRPGAYLIAVEMGNHWDSPVILGEAPTTVQAGSTQYATVTVKPPPARTTVPLAGTFFLPPAWNEPHLSLQFEPMDLAGKTSRDERDLDLSDMKPVPGKPGLYRWDAGLVVAGRYEVTCYTLDLQWVVDTGPRGNRSAAIAVGEPVDATARVLEETTGRWVENVDLLWNGERPNGVMGGSLAHAEWNAETKTYELRVPAGRIELHVHSKEYSTVGQFTFDVRPPQPRARRSGSAHLRRRALSQARRIDNTVARGLAVRPEHRKPRRQQRGLRYGQQWTTTGCISSFATPGRTASTCPISRATNRFPRSRSTSAPASS